VILAAALLVLVALGLFIWGIATGATALYWACVAVSAVAAVLLVVAFLRMRQVATTTGPTRERPEPRLEPRPENRPENRPEPRVEEQPARQVRQEPPATAVLPARPAGATAVVPAQGEPAHAVDYAPTGPGSSSAPADDGPPSGAASPPPPAAAAELAADEPEGADEDPPVEEVEVTDLLLVVDLHDDVYVVDEHPRYHLAGCPWLAGRTGVLLPVDEARTDGFTPCGRCNPDHGLAEVERGRRASRGTS
jgi:hypothetical protein